MYKFETLYNKYRPKNFEDYVGQKNVVTILKNSIKNNYIHPGIIFSGPKGTGKTSISLIFTAAINCIEKNFPCGICEYCQQCFQKEAEDIFHIDAANYTSVENMRTILENIIYVPKYLKYKIIILEEAHMLSKSAFNSILRTLENPPENVKFIFCTTEKEKIIDTVLSRCLILELNKLSVTEIFLQLKKVILKENLKIEEAAIKLISEISEGSLRDALSFLENIVLLYPQQLINENLVEKTFKIMNRKAIERIYTLCLEGNWESAIEEWKYYYNLGYSELEFLKKLSDFFLQLLKSKMKEENLFDNILNNFDLNNQTIIGHWEICLYGLKNLYENSGLVVEMILILFTIMESNLSFTELNNIFPGIKMI